MCNNYVKYFVQKFVATKLILDLYSYKEFAMSELKSEFEYYLKNQSELVDKYQGKFIVIKDSEVKGSFDSHSDAFEFAIKEYDMGTFLIQHCLPGDTGHTQTFHSRVLITV